MGHITTNENCCAIFQIAHRTGSSIYTGEFMNRYNNMGEKLELEIGLEYCLSFTASSRSRYFPRGN